MNMKKLIAIAAALAMAFALAACAPTEFSVTTDDDGVHAVAKNGAEGASAGEITVEPGYGLCINHIVNKGTFHVKATDELGRIVFDNDLTDNIANFVEASGVFDIEISANAADGTVDIIAYDIEAQAQADATMPESVKQAIEGNSASSASAGMANPWQDAKDAAAAADGAGVGTFTLPEAGMQIDGGPVDLTEFRYMDLLAEADGYVGAAELTVRKGVKNPDHDPAYDTADVSGDYTEYAHKWEIEAMDWQVKCFGNEEGKTMKAIWQSDNFSYSILVRGQGDIHDTYGLGNDDIAALVGAIA